LYAVRQVVATRETGEKFDWSKTWVTEMFLSASERKKRMEELERQRGITPEVKRYNEIKGGVITACTGIGLVIFLYVFFEGVILSGKVSPEATEILRRLWVAGVIPIFVGLALLINGLLVSKKLAQTRKQVQQTGQDLLEGPEGGALRPGDTTEFVAPNFSVTEDTTKDLESLRKKR
jgi:hypothetical protein